MNSQLDKFFKDKLADHTIAPSKEAWTKVESGLTKKNNNIIWLRVAAAILMAGLGVIFWLSTQSDEVAQPQIAEVIKQKANETAPEETKIDSENISKEEVQPEVTQNQSAVNQNPPTQ